MVERLAERPVGRSAADWLNDTKRSANLNPILSAHTTSVNGRVALRVRYGNPGSDSEMEATYLVNGSRMFAVSIAGEPHAKLNDLSTYPIYERMVKTFVAK